MALIPAGIRSVSRVIADLEQPLVYSSSSIVPEYAYERSYVSLVEPRASFLPSRSLLRNVEIPLWSSTTLRGTQFSEDGPVPARVRIEVSEPLKDDWLGWLNHVSHDYLLEIARRCQAEVAVRRLEEIHVADHPYPESSIMAGTVKGKGGRVVLWAHSTNPAHVLARRPESIDEVHAVTRTGCQEWERSHPEALVVHNASLMLEAPDELPALDPTAPLSLVVIGGKNTLGAMPFVHQSLHEESYRTFFTGVAGLQQELNIDVFYKPKGIDGENEEWLERIVGSTTGWERIIQHPLKIDLPNMVYVSISVGSGALLEGLGRGIPCVIVKDFPAREYLALGHGVIPTGPTRDTLRIIRSCSNVDRMRAFRQMQLDAYRRETGLGRTDHP